ncbi:hypothetical protein NDR87_33390 [Nocardia sp. CDC159]|uniref:Uncharacterized protein n=1 Tax=Nocardia pulmonis TaxID=2951408 RepID=A0A9X2EDH8_9NOCA|nr:MULTISPECIES: hypothetical protein [Nocardia]MCM6778325.1 hypothetical protein [Nocardia pulmonis]MCM6791279.1 hypothetical protein [Nocardia sp. CDC159]
MRIFGKVAVAGSVWALAMSLSAGPGAATIGPIGSCGSGEFRWTAVEEGIGLSPRYLTFTSVGALRDCVGTVPAITGGTFTGVHTAWSDCMRPADGPITVTIVWSDGQTSVLSGPWPVAMSQPTVGVLAVTEGLGRGERVRIVAHYDIATVDNVVGCLGAGVRTGTGRVLEAASSG